MAQAPDAQAAEFILRLMSSTSISFRISASTGLHKGDRDYQQDQVMILPHPRVAGCALGIVADGMGGKSGGRTASNQVMMTTQQIFERFSPTHEDPEAMLRKLVLEAHLMIKLTAISSEEEPHSTLAAYLVLPTRSAYTVHAGDSRVYHFRGAEMVRRTKDHSYVQHLVDQGRITEGQANDHPQSNLLLGCLGTTDEPPVDIHHIERLEVGDSLMSCSDGLWHYMSPKELGTIINALPPRDATEMLINKARQRAQGGGDNLSIALIRIDALK
jgi:serine/threonine protein phosphatase PrpC